MDQGNAATSASPFATRGRAAMHSSAEELEDELPAVVPISALLAADGEPSAAVDTSALEISVENIDHDPATIAETLAMLEVRAQSAASKLSDLLTALEEPVDESTAASVEHMQKYRAVVSHIDDVVEECVTKMQSLIAKATQLHAELPIVDDVSNEVKQIKKWLTRLEGAAAKILPK